MSSSSSEDGEASPCRLVASSKRKGKEIATEPAPVPHRAATGGFMADARRSGVPLAGEGRAPRSPSRPDHLLSSPLVAPRSASLVDTDGWEEVRRCRSCREDRPARPPSRPVPADLVGRCFNCLETGHVAAACRNPSRCLRCRREGHRSKFCRRSRAPVSPPGGRIRAPPARCVPAPRPHSAASDATCSGGSQSTGRLGSPPAICAPPSSGSEGAGNRGGELCSPLLQPFRPAILRVGPGVTSVSFRVLKKSTMLRTCYPPGAWWL
jgi:hypothetical protein